MRIGFDLISLQNDSKDRGIGTYTRNLIRSIIALDKDNEYVFFVFANRSLPDLLSEPLFTKVRICNIHPQRKRFSWVSAQVLFPYAIAREKIDIFHSTEYILPALSRAKKIITIHDFINSDYPLYFKRSNLIRRLYFVLKNKTLKKADKIIAVSQYTKEKIIDLLKIKEGRIKVIHEAVDGAFAPITDSVAFSRVSDKYGIPVDFLLYVGVLDHHKNVDRLVRAFHCLKDKKINLVLAGARPSDIKYYNGLKKLCEELGLSERVHFLGFVPQPDLVMLYNMAKIFISVSLYEGFGLPALEAMACARPVVVADNTSMKEVVGDCGVLVNPYSIELIVAAIEHLLGSQEIRIRLSRAAFARSREFSWGESCPGNYFLISGACGVIMVDLGIVILNWNGLDFLKLCIPSVTEAVSVYGGDCDILVIDNGSSDGSWGYLKSNFPFVRVLRLKENLSFTKAMNYGINESRGKIVICLNNDVMVEKGFIAPLVRHFKADNIFAVAAKMLCWDKKTLNFGRTSGSFRYGFFTRKIFDWPVHAPTLYACAGGCAVSREKFLSLGGFDEDYDVYWEDLDICYRAWKQGLKVVYEPESLIYHKVHGTNDKKIGRKRIARLSGQNYYLFLVKNIHDKKFLVLHLLSTPILMIIACLTGRAYFVLGIMDSFRQVRLFLRKRLEEENKSILSDKEVLFFSKNG